MRRIIPLGYEFSWSIPCTASNNSREPGEPSINPLHHSFCNLSQHIRLLSTWVARASYKASELSPSNPSHHLVLTTRPMRRPVNIRYGTRRKGRVVCARSSASNFGRSCPRALRLTLCAACELCRYHIWMSRCSRSYPPLATLEARHVSPYNDQDLPNPK